MDGGSSTRSMDDGRLPQETGRAMADRLSISTRFF